MCGIRKGRAMSKDILDISMYLIIAALVVLIVMNSKGFATAVSSVGSTVNSTLGTISGSGYKLAK